MGGGPSTSTASLIGPWPRPLDSAGFHAKPLIVLTAGRGPSPGWMAAQNEMATLSTNSLHRVEAGANHPAFVDDKEHAAAVTRAIHDVVASGADRVNAHRGHTRDPPAGWLVPAVRGAGIRACGSRAPRRAGPGRKGSEGPGARRRTSGPREPPAPCSRVAPQGAVSSSPRADSGTSKVRGVGLAARTSSTAWPCPSRCRVFPVQRTHADEVEHHPPRGHLERLCGIGRDGGGNAGDDGRKGTTGVTAAALPCSSSRMPASRPDSGSRNGHHPSASAPASCTAPGPSAAR